VEPRVGEVGDSSCLRLLVSGQIRFRKIEGGRMIVQVVADVREELNKSAS
jgi:hypothetical protein